MNAVGSFTALDTVRSGVFFANAEDEYQSFSTTQTNLQTGFFNSTNNPFAGLGAGWAVVGDAFTADASNLVIPCNFFQVQCWMYPLLMMGLVGGLMFAAVEPSRPTKEAITYILLATFTYTSAVEVLMGLLPVTMPLLLTVIMVVYAWRFR